MQLVGLGRVCSQAALHSEKCLDPNLPKTSEQGAETILQMSKMQFQSCRPAAAIGTSQLLGISTRPCSPYSTHPASLRVQGHEGPCRSSVQGVQGTAPYRTPCTGAAGVVRECCRRPAAPRKAGLCWVTGMIWESLAAGWINIPAAVGGGALLNKPPGLRTCRNRVRPVSRWQGLLSLGIAQLHVVTKC